MRTERKREIINGILPEQKAFFDEFTLRKKEKRLPKGDKLHDASSIYKSLLYDSDADIPLEQRRLYLIDYLKNILDTDGAEMVIYLRDELNLSIPNEIRQLIS